MHETWSVRTCVLAVVGLWLGAIAMSLLGFYDRWEKLPAFADALSAGALLAGFALPFSFAQTLGARVPLSDAMLIAAVYWPVFGFAHYQFLRRRRPQLFAALVILVAMSAWRWQINAQGMLGI